MAANLVLRSRREACVVLLVLAAHALAPAAPAHAGSFWFVSGSTGSDANACSAFNVPCKTINGAIAKAQSGDAILVAAGIYTGAGPTEIVRVDKTLSISGGYDLGFSTLVGYTIINGEHQRRGLVVDQGAVVQVRDVAIIWGAAADGGGAYVEGGLVGFHLFVVQNRALRGGGIFFNGLIGDYVQLVDSAVFANEYYYQGGGLFIDGFHVIDPIGMPGIVSGGSLTNVTVSNNVCIASQDEEHGPPPPAIGGGVYVSGGYFAALHATFAENTIFDGHVFTQTGAGIAVSNVNGKSWATLQNTLIADGCLAQPGLIRSFGYNVERGNSCNLTVPQDRSNANPQIYPPGVNPGPFTTITHGIASNSPAVDWAKPEWCTISGDQRGVTRPQGVACDVGAYERAEADRAMGFLTHPGMGFADFDRCPTLSWNDGGGPEPNPCRAGADELIEAILGSLGDPRREAMVGVTANLDRSRERNRLPGGR